MATASKMGIGVLSAFVVVTTSGNTRATTAIAVRTPSYVLFAVDGREVWRTDQVVTKSDNVCKIGNEGSVYWMATGSMQWNDSGTNYDVRETIKRYIGDATGPIGVRIRSFGATVRDSLFFDVPYLATRRPLTLKRLIGENDALEIMFATFEGGRPILYMVTFRILVDPITSKYLVQRSESDDAPWAIGGFHEAISDTWRSSPDDIRAQPQFLRKMIETEIAANPADVGLPIAILEIKRNGPHWISKGACTEK